MMAADAAAALAVFAVDPLGAGLVLRGGPCAARDAIVAKAKAMAFGPAGAIPGSSPRPCLRLPSSTTLDRLTGAMDLAATLAAGRPISMPGLLDSPALLVLAMAERWDEPRAALVAAAMDAGRVGVIALDESATPDERISPRLIDRCAYNLDLSALPEDFVPPQDPAVIVGAQALLPRVTIGDEMIEALCAAAAALGADTLRSALLAARCARAAAALAGRDRVSDDDAALAARLVLSSRATRLPPGQEQAAQIPAEPAPADLAAPQPGNSPEQGTQDRLDDLVLRATRVALPAHLLAAPAGEARRTAQLPGRSGDLGGTRGRGRPIGSRPGLPRDGRRLDVIGTLRAAAPWQRLRGRATPEQVMRIRRDDLRVIRCKPRTASTTIFAVDASGSLALARLADAKGAVELLLADCYVRRDTVALIAFRGDSAALLLPPTRAPARARRSLAGLAGGGGTPLAAGILAAAELADAAVRRGETPTIVLLTDGQANIGRTGAPGRVAAQQDATAAAHSVRASGHRTLLIDTAPRRQMLAQSLAQAMGGRYLPLPRADAHAVSDAVRASRA